MKNRSFQPLDPFPANFPNSLGEFVSTLAGNFLLRIKAGNPAVLEIPAGAGNDQVTVGIEGRWRYIAATIERASPGGAAATLDVYVTASDNEFVAGGGGEADETDYSFDLAIVASGALPPGVDLKRLVARAVWSGAAFTALDVLVGPQAGAARHAATHATGSSDPLTPAQIGAATAADLAAHIAAGDPHPAYALETDPRFSDARTPTAHAASHARGAGDAVPGLPPIGGMLPYAGSGDPTGGDYLLADGRLIDKTVYAAFFAAVGHAYNGGVDPGSNMVRLPDKRGRASIGADNMGTAQGAASRIPNSNRARGQNGGEERHQLTVAELASHTHPTLYNSTLAVNAGATWTVPLYTAPGATSSTGGDTPHNNMQPYEVDNWIVRVA